MAEINVGDLIIYQENTYRVLWINPIKEMVYWINIYSTKNIPELVSYNYLLHLLFDSQIKIVGEDQVFNMKVLMDISEKDQKDIDTKWNYIKDIVIPENEPFIYSNIQFRRQLVLEAANKNKCNPTTIYRTLGKYWRCGKKIIGLSSNYGILKKKKKRTYTKKPGRKTNNKIIVDEQIEKIFEKAIKKYYLPSSYTTIKSAYEMMIKEFYAVKVTDLTGEKKLIYTEGDQRPTYNQFKYYLKKKLNDPRYFRKKIGDKEYLSKHRELTKDVFEYAKYPGNVYEIDSTVFDIYLVSEWDSTKIVGRPILFLVVDVYSRSIVGFNVGLEMPSWMVARLAIVNALEDKVNYCKRYGINISKQDWPMSIIPKEIVGDRGEMISKNSSLITKSLGSTVKNTRSYRGDDKPIVENSLGVLRNTLIDFLPGGVRKDFNMRGVEDYRLKAVLTLSDFRKIIIKTILFLNNSRVLDSYKLTKKMIENNIKPIPKEIWNYGIENVDEGMGSISSVLADISLLPEASASITRAGILYKQRIYLSEEMIKDGLLKKAGINGTEKIKIKYDDRDLSVIYYFDLKGCKFYKCNCSDKKFSLLEQSDFEIWSNKTYKSSRDALYKEEEEKINLIQYIEDISQEKKKKSKDAQKKVSKSSRTKNIKENRKKEIENTRIKDSNIRIEIQGDVSRKDKLYKNWSREVHKDIQKILKERTKNDGH